VVLAGSDFMVLFWVALKLELVRKVVGFI